MTHNRDESIARGNLASQPILHEITSPTDSSNEKTILYPEDVPLQNLNSIDSHSQNLLNRKKTGTWWGYETTTGRIAFILNGAMMDDPLSATLPNPPSLSRGHIIPQLLASNDPLTNYIKNTDWSKFANFTLFHFTPTSSTQDQSQGQLQRLTWNGCRTNIKTITKRNFLYLSSTLYQTSDKKIVVDLFNQRLSNHLKDRHERTSPAIFDSHHICKYQHLAPQLSRVKKNIKTVSYTQIEFNKSNSNIAIYYRDFNRKKGFTYSNKQGLNLKNY